MAPTVRLHRLAERPRALLYTACIGDDSAPTLIAKVRRDWSEAATTAAGVGGARPRLSSSQLSAAEMTAVGYRGLTAIEGMIDGLRRGTAATAARATGGG